MAGACAVAAVTAMACAPGPAAATSAAATSTAWKTVWYENFSGRAVNWRQREELDVGQGLRQQGG